MLRTPKKPRAQAAGCILGSVLTARPHLPSWPGSGLRLGQEAPAPHKAGTIHRGAKYAPQQESCSWKQEGQQLEVMRKEEKETREREQRLKTGNLKKVSPLPTHQKNVRTGSAPSPITWKGNGILKILLGAEETVMLMSSSPLQKA